MADKQVLYGEITAFYALSLPEFHMPFHSHSSFEIMYITAGSCTIFCGEETFQVGAGRFVFIGAQVPHRLEIGPEQPCSILNLEFELSGKNGPLQLTRLFSGCADFRELWKKMTSYRQGSDMQNLGYAMKDLIIHLQKDPGQSDFLTELLFSRVMVELSASVIHGAENGGIHYLKKACGYIDRNIHETIRVAEQSAYTGINRSNLQTLVSKILGCSIIAYVNKKRLEEAAFLLANSSMSVTDISFAVGYNSRQHFAHTFGKHYGTGPLSYRKLHAKRMEADTGKEQYLLEGRRATRQKLIE